MVACIYKSPFKWKSPPKRNFLFKRKVIKTSHFKKQSRKKYVSLKQLLAIRDHFKRQPSKKQMDNKDFCSYHKNAKPIIK